VSPATAVRLVLGAACLAAPRTVLRLIGGLDRDDGRTALAARILGVRMVAQAGAGLVFGARWRDVGIVVDLTHSATMLPVARRPEHRRTAMVSAVAAMATAGLDVAAKRRYSGGGPSGEEASARATPTRSAGIARPVFSE
jgi:hypothetical protein